ncbi:MAG: relaxase/mobilization nuclease domain-containing protein, partial [Nostoc sp.]
LNPEAEKVVHHVSLSLSPGEQLDNDTWCEIADKYIEEMGYTANQYAIYRHNDRNHDHIHICASRISLDDGKITRDSWEYVRSEKIIRQLELEYGLQQTKSSKEKLNRAPSYGQQQRIEREQLEYEQGERNTPPQQSIKTQLIELIDRASQDKPTMPQLVERLQLQGVEVRYGLTRNGKSKGISYSWNDQKFSGTSLGAAYTWPGLQKHKRIDYQPQRDDGHIEHLLKNPREQTVVSQQLETSPEHLGIASSPVREIERGSSQSFEAITAIVRYLELQEIEQSLTKSSLSETLPQLVEQLSQYRQQLQERRTAFDELSSAIADVEQQLRSQRAMDAISDFIEQSVVESTLSETLPQLTEQLSQYRQQLEARRTAFDGLDAAITQELQSHVEKRAISSIYDYIEQSTVESALTEAVLELTQQLSQSQQQQEAGRSIFDDLEAAIVYLEQLHRSQTTVDAIALNKTPNITTDEPKLKHNLSAELYNYYSTDLQNLLVTDRDKEIAIRALLDNKPVQDVEEIIFASPAGWTIDEARELVLIANNQLASNREQKQSSPQFTPPPEDESLRPVLQYYLTHTRALTNFLVQPLQRQGLAYIDPYEKVVFIKRDLDGEKSGALVWDTHRQDNRAFEYPENSDRSSCWFHFKLGVSADDKIERVYLCSSPIDALSMAEIDREGHKGQLPARTMYMAVDDPDNLPFEVLRKINRIGLAFNNDDRGNETSLVVQSMLPQAKRIAPSGRTWNEILIERQQEELEQKQRGRGFSR